MYSSHLRYFNIEILRSTRIKTEMAQSNINAFQINN